MMQKTLDKLCCPFDKYNLEITKIIHEISGEIIEGFLICQECNHIFPIINGIPVLIPDEYRDQQLEENFYQKWQLFLKENEVKNFHISPLHSKNSNQKEITNKYLS